MDEQPVSKLKKEIIEWVKVILIAFVLTMIIRSFLVAPFMISGESMMPTLEDGERVIVNELVYRFSEPKRGDIVVFYYPEEDKDLVKRVIGLPGDTVEMKNDQLLINGTKVEEPYLAESKKFFLGNSGVLTEDFEPVKVNSNQFFVMGDNRWNSKDSRAIGTISEEQIIGRVELVFWPFDQWQWVNRK